jgi:drug/metabolite transporter (DMT)-like permease
MVQQYILIALFISLCWGIVPVAHKSILYLSPITIMLFSAFIYTFLIIIYASFNKKIIYKDIHNISKKDIIIIIFSSAIAAFFGNVLYFKILKNHDSSIISALIYSSPIFTLIIAYLFFKERINPIGIIGILSIVFGVICIAMNNATSKELEYFATI